MKIAYFEDSDTLYIELDPRHIDETRDFDENTLLDLDAAGNICGITLEHASERTDLDRLSISGLAA